MMPDLSDLSIAPDQVCFLIFKARQLNAKDVVTEPDPGSNPIDDGAASVLEDHKDDPTRSEVIGAIQAMNGDERLDLMTLAILGRDDADIAEWTSLRTEAEQAVGPRIVAELVEMPMLGDYLEEGLSKFGASCSEYEA